MSNIKTEQELEVYRKNAKAHKKIEMELKQIIKPWVNWETLNNLIGDMCKKLWVIPWFKWVYWFPANLCVSINEVIVHGIPTKKMVLKDWDVVKFDFWVRDNLVGLNTDAAFTMLIWNNPDSKKEKFIKVCEQALYKWVSKAIVWNTTGDIGHAIQKYVESQGYHIVRDLTGHWVWFKLHEKPHIPNFWNPWMWVRLKKNMTLAIEPIIWYSSWAIVCNEWNWNIKIADGSIGGQFEHTIVVKEWYPEILV